MSDTDTILRAIEATRLEQATRVAELHGEVRTGFRRIDDTLRINEGRVSRHSERFKALQAKRGEVSGGYQTRPKAEKPAWIKYVVIPGSSAVAGMVAVKILPPLLKLLAEIVQ